LVFFKPKNPIFKYIFKNDGDTNHVLKIWTYPFFWIDELEFQIQIPIFQEKNLNPKYYFKTWAIKI